jgi:lipid II:glycine glycyltransferase (peptidoglycan interpeptide bridge formation enzyme)
MHLIEVEEKDKQRYNDFVIGHDGSFLQSWDWGNWQEFAGKQAHRFFINDDTGVTLLAGQVVTTAALLNKFYLYMPYGPVVHDPNDQEVLAFFITELQKLFPKTIFIRIEPQWRTTHQLPGIKSTNIQPGRTLIVDIKQSEETLLSQMHPKTRYNIRLAQKHGVEIEQETFSNNEHSLFFKEAFKLITVTAERQGYLNHPLAYYEKLLDFFSKNKSENALSIAVYRAIYNKSLLASSVMIDFGATRTYLFGGSSDQQRNVMAPYALHWQAMMDAKKMGLEMYDFDGLELSVGKQAQFARFKQGFGGQIVEFSGAYDIIQNGLWYTIYSVLRKINRFIKHLSTKY